eukprot:c24206_g14_i3 orf=126-1532(+)
MYAGAFPESSSYCSNVWRWRDNQNTKIDPRSPDYLCKITPESLSGWDNPCWFQAEPHRRRSLPPVKKVEDVELCNKVREEQKIHYESSQKRHFVLSPSVDKHEKSQDEKDSAVTLVALLKVCANQKELHRGSRVHVDIVKCALVEKNVFVGTALVNMYAKWGALDKAQVVFDELPILNVISWNALIAGYSEHGPSEEALKCLEQMQVEGIQPDVASFACMFKACSNMVYIDKGASLHLEVFQKGLHKDLTISNAIIGMYAKFGLLVEAQEVFDDLPVRDVVSWNALISGYADHGPISEALNCYKEMQLDGISLDAVTYACVMKACGCIGALDTCREIHLEITKKGLQEDVTDNALVGLYAKCGSNCDAQDVFDKLPVKELISWTSLIAGYAEHGYDEEALKCFGRMPAERVSPDAITYVCLLKACGRTGALDKGREIHAEVERTGLLQKDLVIGNTVVDMYARCGFLA